MMRCPKFEEENIHLQSKFYPLPNFKRCFILEGKIPQANHQLSNMNWTLMIRTNDREHDQTSFGEVLPCGLSGLHCFFLSREYF